MRINNKKYKNILLNRQYPFCMAAKIFIFRVVKNRKETRIVSKSQKGNKKGKRVKIRIGNTAICHILGRITF